MPEASAPTLVTLRSQHPHSAKVEWWLAVAPYGDPVFTGQVNNAAIARGERNIDYDGGVGAAEAGMTLWVGSTPGTYDIGKVRIREIGSYVGGTGEIIVAENDDIEWADDLYLTCPGAYGFRELWGVLPRITEAGGVVTFYEDYDETYNDPVDDVLPPKANAGAPVCAFLDTGGYVDIAFVGNESYTTEVGAAIATYAWDFADGVVQSGSANAAGTCLNPNVVRFTGTGFRYVSLTVTDNTAQARTGTVYVPVWIFNRTTAAPVPVTVRNHSADPSWKLSIQAYTTETNVEDVFYNYPDGALVVLFTEAEWPDGSTDIGGTCYRDNIQFVGWLDSESLVFDYDSGTIAFDAISHETMMKKLPGYAYTLEDDDTPSDWYEVADLNIDRAVHAHLERRSTVNQVCHVDRLGDGTDRTVAVQSYPDASVLDQVQEHLLNDAMALLLSDKQGIIRITRNPQFMDAIDRDTVDVVCTLVNTDLLNEIDETRSHHPEVGYVRLGGFAYDTPLLSEAPGACPTRQEDDIHREGFLVEDQTEINLWSGLMYTNANNPYPSVPLELAGHWPVFDPAFQEYVRLTITDQLGRNVWSSDRFVVRRVSFKDSNADNTSVTELVVEKENDILSGVTLVVPAPPAPTSVIYNPPPSPTPPPNWCGSLEKVILRTSQGIFITENFNAVVPTDVFWEASNNNLSANQRENIRDMAFDWQDGDRLFMVCDHATEGGAFRCSNIWGAAAWEQRFDNDYAYQTIDAAGGFCSPINAACLTPAGIWWAVGIDPTSGYISFIAGYEFPCAVAGWAGDGCRRHKRVFYSLDSLDTCPLGDDLTHDGAGTCGAGHCALIDAMAGSITSVAGNSVFSYNCAWGAGSDRHRGYSANAGLAVTTSGAPPDDGQVFAGAGHLWQTRAGSIIVFYTDTGAFADDFAISLDDGVTWAVNADLLPGTPADSGQSLTIHFLDPNNMMMIEDVLTIWYSTDQGFTWALADATPDEAYCIAACADTAWPIPDGKGYITGATTPVDDDSWVFLTRDLGVSWENRTGNLGDFLDHGSDIIYEIIPVQEGC